MSARLLQFSRRSITTARPLPAFPFLRRSFNASPGRLLHNRFQSTIAENSTQPSFFQRIWNSPVGVKTVHFWAPVMKWSIVIAGISDFYRPAEKLSLTQNLALTATGAIWTRWCLIIKPRNILLAAVNFFLGCVGVTQVTRIFMNRRSSQNAASVGVSGGAGGGESLAKEIETQAKGAVDAVKSVVKKEV